MTIFMTLWFNIAVVGKRRAPGQCCIVDMNISPCKSVEMPQGRSLRVQLPGGHGWSSSRTGLRESCGSVTVHAVGSWVTVGDVLADAAARRPCVHGRI